jgi:hypothetical protein
MRFRCGPINNEEEKEKLRLLREEIEHLSYEERELDERVEIQTSTIKELLSNPQTMK